MLLRGVSLWSCAVIFIILSLAIFLKVPSDNNRLELDSMLYDRIAKNFVSNFTLKDPRNPTIMPVTAMGYPLFLGLIFKVFGVNYKVVTIIQILLSIISIFLIYNICLILFNINIAKISLILSSVNLSFLVHSQFILTEILLTLLLLLFLYFFVRYLKFNNLSNLFFSGFFLGVSILVKPVALFFIPVPILIIILNSRRFYREQLSVIIFLLPFLIPVSSYIFFNYQKYNSVSLNPAGYENIYRYYLPRLLAKKNNISLHEAEIIVDKLVKEDNNSQLKYGPELQSLLVENIVKNPLIALSVWFKNVAKTYLGLYTTELKVLFNNNIKGGSCSYFKMSGNFFEKIKNYITCGSNSKIINLIGFYELIYLFMQYLLIVFVFLNFINKKQYLNLFLLLSFIFYFALITGHDGFGRYRAIFEPVLIILNSVGIYIFYNLCLKREKYA